MLNVDHSDAMDSEENNYDLRTFSFSPLPERFKWPNLIQAVYQVPSYGAGFCQRPFAAPLGERVIVLGLNSLRLPSGSIAHPEFNAAKKTYGGRYIPDPSHESIPPFRISEDQKRWMDSRTFRQYRLSQLGLQTVSEESGAKIRFAHHEGAYLHIKKDGSLGGSCEPFLVISFPISMTIADRLRVNCWKLRILWREPFLSISATLYRGWQMAKSTMQG